MSFGSLQIGVSALTTAQRAVETAAHNVANSAIPGYTRQRLAITAGTPAAGVAGAAGTGMVGTGVQVVAIDRLRDALADVAVRGEAASAGAALGRAEVLDRAQGILGGYGSGVPDAMSKLWASFDQLALSPADPAARQLVVDAASTFAEGIRTAADSLDRLRNDVNSELQGVVVEINSIAAEVADLNRRIADAVTTSQAPNDLLDRRDLALDRLAEISGATVRPSVNGMVDVSLGGATLVRGVATEPLVMTNAPAFTLEGRPAALGGELAGRVSALTTDLVQFGQLLDDVALAVGDAVNAQHALGYTTGGAAGGPVFSGATAREFALAPGLTPAGLAVAASPAASPFDGENALALARLRAADPVTGVSLGDRVHGLAATLGSRAATAARTADAALSGFASVRDAREARNGVSVDEELIELVKFQHAYDAAARVISIADGMLDTLINRTGAGR